MIFLKVEVFCYGISLNHGKKKKSFFFVCFLFSSKMQPNILDLKPRVHVDFIKLFVIENIPKHCFVI